MTVPASSKSLSTLESRTYLPSTEALHLSVMRPRTLPEWSWSVSSSSSLSRYLMMRAQDWRKASSLSVRSVSLSPGDTVVMVSWAPCILECSEKRLLL